MSQNICEEEPNEKMFERTTMYTCDHMTFCQLLCISGDCGMAPNPRKPSLQDFTGLHTFVVSNFVKPKPYIYWSKFRDWLVATICG